MSIIRNNIEISKIIKGGVEFSKVIRNGIELWNAKENFILNGTFEDSSNITLEPEWTIVSQQAVYDGNGGAITFDLSSTLSEEISYELILQASNISTFVRFALNIEGASSVEVLPFTTYEIGSSGEVKIIFTVPTGNTDSDKVVLRASSLAGAYTIDNVNLSLADEATNVLNGTFDDGAYLTLGGAWSVSGGKLNFDDSNSDDVTFYLNGYIEVGGVYNFNFTVDSGTIRIENLNEQSVFTNYTAGTYTISYTNTTGLPVNNITLEFSNGAGATAASIDNVSLEYAGTELVINGGFDTNSDWVLSSATISGGLCTMTSSGGAMTYFYQSSLNLTAATFYKISFTANRLSGDTDLTFVSGNGNNVAGAPIVSSSGNYEFTFAPSSNVNNFGLKRNSGGTGAVWEVDNVSVKEVITGEELITDPDFSNGLTDWNIQGGANNWAINSDGYVELVSSSESSLIANNDNVLIDGGSNLYMIEVDVEITGTRGLRVLDENGGNIFLSNGLNTIVTELFVDKLFIKPSNVGGTGDVIVKSASVKEILN